MNSMSSTGNISDSFFPSCVWNVKMMGLIITYYYIASKEVRLQMSPCAASGLPLPCAGRYWSVEVNHAARRKTRSRALEENLFRVCEFTKLCKFCVFFFSPPSLSNRISALNSALCGSAGNICFVMTACFSPSSLVGVLCFLWRALSSVCCEIIVTQVISSFTVCL